MGAREFYDGLLQVGGHVMQALDISQPIQFKNVLLATDFSPSSQSALLYSLSLARRWKARVFIAHVVNPTAIFGHEAVQRAINDAWREAHTEITNQLIAGRLEGIENHVVVRQGDVWEELERMIGEFKADLVVTGTRGRSGVWKMLLGSTAERIFRQSPVPVLTIGPNAPPEAPAEGPRRILYSTGFAPQSLNAGRYALSLAEQNRAYLAMVYVITNVPPDTDRERLRQEGKQRLGELIPSGAKLASPPDLFVEFGDAPTCILNVAEQWRPQLVVLGIRRHAKDAKRITWATAYNVVTNAPCSVLTVKTPEEME
jgi:nucleotide-binding universal stress UspA family protein